MEVTEITVGINKIPVRTAVVPVEVSTVTVGTSQIPVENHCFSSGSY